MIKKKTWCLEKLKENEYEKEFKRELEKKNTKNEPKTWEIMKTNIKESTEKGKHTLEPKKPWMTQYILELIHQRNEARKVDYSNYKHIKNQITEECRRAKNQWLEKECNEIDYCLKKNFTDKAYNKVKSSQTTPRTKSNIVKDKEGKILFDNESVSDGKSIWKNCMKEKK